MNKSIQEWRHDWITFIADLTLLLSLEVQQPLSSSATATTTTRPPPRPPRPLLAARPTPSLQTRSEMLFCICYTGHALTWTKRVVLLVMFYDFSSSFNTVQPLILRDKLLQMSETRPSILYYGRRHQKTPECQAGELTLWSVALVHHKELCSAPSSSPFTRQTSSTTLSYATCRSFQMILQ